MFHFMWFSTEICVKYFVLNLYLFFDGCMGDLVGAVFVGGWMDRVNIV